ncbi:nuclear transport factor 2 family protein [Collinsella intestinalis]|uniref:nuclear transport factor 2 family protein n=1 Tax=Collinsella intestinalis TaxID=147207 RepID=UPI0025A40BB9|nr:nuclear transport factor 2 family protein [Collinsella intestinalis]MDM8163863.1 nuclear transport factor 2 family protein [Collinsella intestinalis]
MSDQLNDQLIETSQRFWDAMEHADEAGMRAVADPECTFVHIGITAPLDQEIGFYTSGAFQPTSIVFHSQIPSVFGDTGVVITDCDYALLLDGKETTHHFAVTEVFNRVDDAWKLVTFSFTALVY